MDTLNASQPTGPAPATPDPSFEPFYFGNADQPLYGCYHKPITGSNRDCVAVLCYPIGAEYIRSHRAYRHLALRLAKAGFPVLRFDYLGCGDASGDFEDGNVDLWQRGILLAIDEASRRARAKSICLVALRFGATMAMTIGARRHDVDGLVLWNPVVDGEAYIKALRKWHRDVIETEPRKHAVDSDHREATEVVGYPFSTSLIEQIIAAEPLAGSRPPVHNALLLETGDDADAARVNQWLNQTGVNVTHHKEPGPQMWLTEPYQAVIPHETLQAVVAWFSKVYA